MTQLKTVGRAGGGIGLLIVAMICLNIVSSKLNARIDVTEESIYTLSPGTQKILTGLEKKVDAKLYFSRSIKELPVQIKTFATRVEEILQEYSARSGGKLTLEVLDPKPDTDDEEWARKYGVNGIALPSGTELFFGVVFLQGAHEVAIPYFDPRREEFLEYDLSEAVLRSQSAERPKIGVLSSMNIVNDSAPSPYGPQQAQEWAFVSELRKSFDVNAVAKDAKEIPKDFRVLVVHHPKKLADETLYAIDQFVLGGGRAIVLVDPMSRIDQATTGRTPQGHPTQPQFFSDFKKLFAAWGIRYSPVEMIGDRDRSTMINTGNQTLDYPFFVNFTKDGLSKDSIVTNKITSFMFAEGGHVGVVEGAAINMESLVKAGNSSGLVKPLYGNFNNPLMLVPGFKPDDKEYTLAGIFSGKFKSAFPLGVPGAKEGVKESVSESVVLVIADVDFIADHNSVDRIRFLNQTMLRPKNGNLPLMVNAVDYLGGSPDLISIRSKGRLSRPFTVVQDLQKSAQDKWQKVEEDLSNQIAEVQKKLRELQKQRSDGAALTLSPAQQEEIAKFREEERQVRKKRREVRKNLREDIEALGIKITALNMILVPSFVSIFGVFSFLRRSRRNRQGGRKK